MRLEESARPATEHRTPRTTGLDRPQVGPLRKLISDGDRGAGAFVRAGLGVTA